MCKSSLYVPIFLSNINFISCKAYNNANGGIRMERVHTGKIVDCELIGNAYAIELHGCGKFMMHDASNFKIVTIKHDFKRIKNKNRKLIVIL